MSPLELFFGVLWLLPLFVLGFLAWRHHHRRAKRRYTVSSSPRLPLSSSLRRGCACVEILFPLALAALFIATGLAAWIATDEITRRL